MLMPRIHSLIIMYTTTLTPLGLHIYIYIYIYAFIQHTKELAQQTKPILTPLWQIHVVCEWRGGAQQEKDTP